MLKPITLGALTCALLAGSIAPSAAQFFTPPTASEFIYPAPGSWMGKASSTSNYSIANINTAYGTVDLYLSSWTSPGGPGEYIWQFAQPGSDPGVPGNIIAQGTFPYLNTMDLEVGFVDVGGSYELLVAYYLNGVGHFMDIYKLNGGMTAPGYAGTMTLSNSPQYGRIRIDCHKTYGVAVAWQYPGVGIQTMVGNVGSYSGVTTLNGTQDEAGPDVAFSHSNGPLNVHYVYQNQITGDITESVADWSVLLGTPGFYWPNVEDVNPAPLIQDQRIVLDCPDHFNVENWAYTYTDNANVFVRYVDYNSGTPFSTVSVNSGALGNFPIVGAYKVFSPTLYYGEGYMGSTDHIHVGWYATDGGGFNGYIGIQMDEKGANLVSAPDYMQLPNAFTPNIYPLPLPPGIAYSRMSDPGLAPNYMYATYYDLTNDFNLHHAFHPWGAPVFKGGHPVALHPECGPQVAVKQTAGAVTVSPNPFTSEVSTTFTLQESGTVQLQLSDITGRKVAESSSSAEKGTHQFSTGSLSALPPGAYILHISLNGKYVGQQKVVKQ